MSDHCNESDRVILSTELVSHPPKRSKHVGIAQQLDMQLDTAG